MSHYDRVHGDVYIPASQHMTKYKKLKSCHMGHVVGNDRTSLMVCVCVCVWIGLRTIIILSFLEN